MNLRMKELLLIVFISVLHGSYAPFPEGHPYRFLNPIIEPWWNKISKDSQREVLSAWKRVEPSAFALSRLVEAKVDLLSGRTPSGPRKPYPSEYYEEVMETQSEAEAESTSEEESAPEAEAESASAESKPSSYAY